MHDTLTPCLNFPTHSSDSILQQTKTLRCYWMVFMNEKCVIYSCSEGIFLGYSNTLPVVVVILMELSTSFIASKFFLWRSNMLTYFLSRPTVKSNVMGVVYLLFLNVKSVSCLIFLISGVRLFISSVSSIKRDHCFVILGVICFFLAGFLIVLFGIFVRRFLCFFCDVMGYWYFWRDCPSRWWWYPSLLDC